MKTQPHPPPQVSQQSCKHLGCCQSEHLYSLRVLSVFCMSPLSDRCFANICSISIACLFHPLTQSSAAQKFLIMKSSLAHFFFFLDYTLGVISKNSMPKSKSWRFSLMLSTKSIVFCFRLKSMIHFELIFIECVRFKLRFIFLLFCFVVLPLMSNCSICRRDSTGSQDLTVQL